MDWAPAVRVTVDGTDMSAIFRQRLVSMQLTDTAGVQSDTVSIVLADGGPFGKLELPKTGAEIEVALGYGFSAQVVGLYVAEEIGASGPPDQVTIRGYSSPFGGTNGGKAPINDAKTRSWPDGLTVSAIVAKIAKEDGMQAAVSAEAGKVKPGHLDQIDESDMALLSRMARDNGLIFKPGGGKLVMVKAGESTSASGQKIPTVSLRPPQVSRWTLAVKRPEAVKKVVTKYRNLKTNTTEEVEMESPSATGGDGSYGDKLLAQVTTTRKVQTTYTSKETATAAADAAAKEAYRKSQQMDVDLPGRADLMAEGRLILSGFRPGVDREWLIAEVQHQMDSQGWRTRVQCELPPV
ncbi:phage late control D family protein [Fuscibacter oryzae]|uniref:Late control protein D n=1 Tax=Fuscibacter oryzae TaxID=2803939 RepID=A0A8J7SU72_9RHOB|nr:contractile injection system protein, VgrG/Pvc8 family [Fuscibacter oryzae]MBL4929315.1 late control protein D [Fuscibacter oryzae]